MPLSKAIQELLAQITDEGERKGIEQQFEKYPFMQERFAANLRQEDYDRNLNKLKTEREQERALVEQYQTESKRWKDWAANNVPKHEELVKNYAQLEAEKKALQDQIATASAAAAAGGGDGNVDTNELVKRVNEEIGKRGYVSSADVQKIAAEQAAKLVSEEASKLRDNFFKTDVPSIMAFNNAIIELQFKSREEFNQPLDMIALTKYMTENKVEDPRKAYDQMTAEKRTALQVEKIRKEEHDKVEKEMASKFNLPGSGAVPAVTELGPLQARLLKQTVSVPEGANPGDNQLAYAAAAELRAENKW